jgi:uncharacterized protein
VIQGFFRLVFYVFIAYIVYFVIRLVFPAQRPTRTARPPQEAAGTMVKDETCNIYLPREHATKEIIDGKEYFFCSQECRKKFLEQKKNGG